MSDEIDFLGSSLLNRVTANNREVQKQARRNMRINLGLQLANAGIKYGNQVLQNRASTFAQTNEDVLATKSLLRSAVDNAQTLQEEAEQASQFAGGELAWLAENKILPNLRASFEANADEIGASQADIARYLNQQSLEKAKELLPIWKDAVNASYDIPENAVVDYNSYVKLNDGIPDNMAGLLGKKLGTLFSDRTETDIREEVRDSIRDNSFSNSAARLQLFNDRLSQGYNEVAAKSFANTTIATNIEGIRRREDLPFEVQSRKPATMQFFERGTAYSVPVMEITLVQDGVTTTTYAPRGSLKPDEEGNLKYEVSAKDQAQFDKWVGSEEGAEVLNQPNVNTSVNTNSSTFLLASQEELLQGIEDGIYRANPNPIRTNDAKVGIFGETVVEETYEILPSGRNVDPTKSLPVGTITNRRIQGDAATTLPLQFQGMPDELKELGYTEFSNVISQLSLRNGEGVPADLVDRFFTGTSDRYEELIRSNRGRTLNFNELYKEKRDFLGFKVTKLSERIRLTFDEIDSESAMKIAASAYAGQLVSSYDPDTEEFSNRLNQINPDIAPDISALYGIERLTAEDVPVRISEKARTQTAQAAYRNYAQLSSDPSIDPVEKVFYAQELLNMSAIQNTAIDFLSLPEDQQQILLSKYGARIGETFVRDDGETVGTSITLAELVEDDAAGQSPTLRQRMADPNPPPAAVAEAEVVTAEDIRTRRERREQERQDRIINIVPAIVEAFSPTDNQRLQRLERQEINEAASQQYENNDSRIAAMETLRLQQNVRRENIQNGLINLEDVLDPK